MEVENIFDNLEDGDLEIMNESQLIYTDPMAASGTLNNSNSESETMGHMISDEFK